MKTIWTSLKRHKSLLLFIAILFLFGVVTGFLFYFKQESSVKETVSLSLTNLFQNNVFTIKNIFYHFIILLIVCSTLFCFIGLPILVIYIFFEGLTIGFILPIFFSLFKINAILYFLLYFLLVKFFFVFLLFMLFVKSIYYLKSYLICLKKKSYDFIKSLKYIVVLIFIILMNDCFVYFVSNRILILLLGGK